MTTSMLTTNNGAVRASDVDRERALSLLRDHWLAGRLTLDEYEERCDEATSACYIDELRWSVRELPYPLPEHGAAGLAPAPPAVAQKPAPPEPPASGSTATLSLVLGTLALSIAWIPFFFMLALPASTWAWALGRRIRRADRDLVRSDIRVVATIGEVLGIIATTIACMWLGACGFIIVAA